MQDARGKMVIGEKLGAHGIDRKDGAVCSDGADDNADGAVCSDGIADNSDVAKMPLISVIIPVFNGEDRVERAIESVLSQTVENMEIIIVDDGSTDGTYEVIERIAEKDLRIRILRNSINIGTAKARNRAIDECRGELVAFLDSDDTWHPEKLEKQLDVFRNSDADIVYCSYFLVCESEGSKRKAYHVPKTTDIEAMLRENVIGCSTVLMRREALRKHRFDPEFYHEDYVLWLELMNDGYRARGCTETLVDYTLTRRSRSYNKIICAKQRWRIYREKLKLPFLKSAGLFLRYAVSGLKKYGGVMNFIALR
ncbi:MAG: glycosyltransferase family 2 protein [Christensenellaceae bacterium]|nr:glycosyltransferase family 2 protein [Christensenellaceae bacterium]